MTGHIATREGPPAGFADARSGAGTARGAPAAGIGSIDLTIGGMSCASCVGRVEQALRAVPGVSEAAVNLATHGASVRHSGTVTIEALTTAVAKAGYEAAPVVALEPAANRQERAQDKERTQLRALLLAAALLSAPVLLLEMGAHLSPALHHWIEARLGQRTNWIVQGVLTTLVLAWPGRVFFTKGLTTLLRGAPDMNALVAVGAGAAWTFSVIATLAPSVLPAGTANVYFEAAALIVTLVLGGRYLELRARGRTSAAVRRLIDLQPATAHVRRGTEVVTLPVAEVRLDDLIEARPGDRIATDGVVVDGASHVDESMITGEPVPPLKQAGAKVVAGTINTTGAFTYRATGIGAQTVLAGIIRMVETAQGTKLPIQAVIDRVSMWFVPAIMALSALTFVAWLIWGPTPALSHAIVNAVAVLIIACPCAMGLATPMSIMVGTGRGADLGLLFRRGDALQHLQTVGIVAVDKTGTLTLGRPEATDFIVRPGFDEEHVLALAAAVEAKSEHPLARAIVEAAERRGLALATATDFLTTVGAGVVATVAGRKVAIGAASFMATLGIESLPLEAEAQTLAAEGKTPVFCAIDGELAAILAVSDPMKPTTPAAIAALKGLGLEVVMITGDNSVTANAIARRLGIDRVVAQVLPSGKVETIETLRTGGRVVAFVGDGINDAPALAAADIGIAIGTGTEIAIEAADLVLASGDLMGVARAIDLSRATMRNIRQNLFWAFGYNAVLIPIAAGVLYPTFGILLSPMFAAAAMALSSVSVVANALRLQYQRL